jgi:hypothetical protein
MGPGACAPAGGPRQLGAQVRNVCSMQFPYSPSLLPKARTEQANSKHHCKSIAGTVNTTPEAILWRGSYSHSKQIVHVS